MESALSRSGLTVYSLGFERPDLQPEAHIAFKVIPGQMERDQWIIEEVQDVTERPGTRIENNDIDFVSSHAGILEVVDEVCRQDHPLELLIDEQIRQSLQLRGFQHYLPQYGEVVLVRREEQERKHFSEEEALDTRIQRSGQISHLYAILCSSPISTTISIVKFQSCLLCLAGWKSHQVFIDNYPAHMESASLQDGILYAKISVFPSRLEPGHDHESRVGGLQEKVENPVGDERPEFLVDNGRAQATSPPPTPNLVGKRERNK
ncbi:MAG: hypothetical protein Q9160_002318 [Pyrenula sp. 1 TL-2023]